MKKFLKVVGIIILCFVLLIGIYSAFIFLARGDEKVPLDPELTPKVTSLTLSEQNDAYYSLEKLNFINEDKESDIAAMVNKWNQAEAENIIGQNQANLALIDEALTKQVYIDPNIDIKNINFIDNFFVQGFRKKRTAARLLVIRGKLLIEQGKAQEGFDVLIKVVKFGHMLEKDQPTIIQYLVAQAIKGMGLTDMKAVWQKIKFDKNYLALKAQELEGYRDDGSALGESLKIEYQAIYNTLPMYRNTHDYNPMETYWPGSYAPMSNFFFKSWLYKPGKTQKLMAEIFKDKISEAKQACDKDILAYESSQTDYSAPGPNSWSGLLKAIFTENFYGKVMVDGVKQGYSEIYKKRCLSEKRIDEVVALMQ